MSALHNEHVVLYFKWGAWCRKQAGRMMSYEFWTQWYYDELDGNDIVQWHTMNREITNND